MPSAEVQSSALTHSMLPASNAAVTETGTAPPLPPDILSTLSNFLLCAAKVEDGERNDGPSARPTPTTSRREKD
eukprot:2251472-Rhodomonas_salina.1